MIPRRIWRSTARIVASGPCPAIAPVSPRQKSDVLVAVDVREMGAGRLVHEERERPRPLDHPVHRDAVEQRALRPLEQRLRARVGLFERGHLGCHELRESRPVEDPGACHRSPPRPDRPAARCRGDDARRSGSPLPGPCGAPDSRAGARRGTWKAPGRRQARDMETPRAGEPARGVGRGAGVSERREPSRTGGRRRGRRRPRRRGAGAPGRSRSPPCPSPGATTASTLTFRVRGATPSAPAREPIAQTVYAVPAERSSGPGFTASGQVALSLSRQTFRSYEPAASLRYPAASG